MGLDSQRNDMKAPHQEYWSGCQVVNKLDSTAPKEWRELLLQSGSAMKTARKAMAIYIQEPMNTQLAGKSPRLFAYIPAAAW
jgi:hypothetical protein